MLFTLYASLVLKKSWENKAGMNEEDRNEKRTGV